MKKREKADDEEEEEEEENGWTSPKNPAPAAIVITSPNQLPEPITNRYLVHQPRPIPLERQKDPEDLVPNQRGTGTARSPKSSHQRRRSKDSIDEEKRIERGGNTDRKRKETEERGEEKSSEKFQKKNTPEKKTTKKPMKGQKRPQARCRCHPTPCPVLKEYERPPRKTFI